MDMHFLSLCDFPLLFQQILQCFHRVVQTLSHVPLCDPVDCSTPDFPFTVSQSWFKFMSVDLVMPVNHLILCRPFSSCPHSSRHHGPSNESAPLIRWPKYWTCTQAVSKVAELLQWCSSRSKCKCNRWSVGLAEKPPSGSPSELQSSARVLLFLHGPGQTVLVLFH